MQLYTHYVALFPRRVSRAAETKSQVSHLVPPELENLQNIFLGVEAQVLSNVTTVLFTFKQNLIFLSQIIVSSYRVCLA